MTELQQPAITVDGADFPTSIQWSLSRRFAFRLWAVYFVICLLPFATVFIERLNVWRRIADTVGRWPIAHVLAWPEHSPPVRIPGTDFLPDYLAMVVLGVISVVLAVGWSLLDRRRANYSQLFVWIHTGVRFVLASLLLWYGWRKIVPTQFGAHISWTRLVQPVGQLTPMDLLWAFMSASRSYTVFTGIVEWSAGVLLLLRRTAMAGALLGAAAMGNVLALNLAYDVNVKLAAMVMLVMALFVLAPHARALYTFFLLNQPSSPAGLSPLLRDQRGDRIARLAGAVLAVMIISYTYADAHVVADDDPVLDGVWAVESIYRNGAAVPRWLGDASAWRYVIFENGIDIVTVDGSATAYRAMFDAGAATIALRPRAPIPGRLPGRAMTLRVEHPDSQRLELTGVDRNGAGEVVRLRRVELSTYLLLTHTHTWRW